MALRDDVKLRPRSHHFRAYSQAHPSPLHDEEQEELPAYVGTAVTAEGA